MAHMSPSYLGGRFKKETGMSFTDYLLQFRMGKAKGLLKNNRDLSCKEVALLVGYEDYAQFSKMFHKHEGISPKEFQKSNKKR